MSADLAPYAASEAHSRGRLHAEPPPGNRGESVFMLMEQMEQRR